MTREEAIKMLKSKMDGHTDTSYEWAETVRIAIEALEQKPSEDCVSRQAVLAVPSVTPARPNNQVHLCDSCSYDYPDCDSKDRDVIFGNGKGNDNICACSKYAPAKPKGEYLTQEPCEDWCDVSSDEMTLEQARQAVKDLRKKLAEYLMKETCEDCISRQAVLDQTYLWSKDEFLRVTNPFDYLRKRINSLPPIKPQPKIGRWIFVDKAHEHAHCFECDYGNVDLMDGRPHNFCPNCGAKMQEVKE